MQDVQRKRCNVPIGTPRRPFKETARAEAARGATRATGTKRRAGHDRWRGAKTRKAEKGPRPTEPEGRRTRRFKSFKEALKRRRRPDAKHAKIGWASIRLVVPSMGPEQTRGHKEGQGDPEVPWETAGTEDK